VVELRLLSELPTPRVPRIARNTIENFRPSLAARIAARALPQLEFRIQQ
jgi:hypothetical protein